MKKTSHSNAFKTLVINSCGKSKATNHPNQPTCDDLAIAEKRKKSPRIQ